MVLPNQSHVTVFFFFVFWFFGCFNKVPRKIRKERTKRTGSKFSTTEKFHKIVADDTGDMDLVFDKACWSKSTALAK